VTDRLTIVRDRDDVMHLPSYEAGYQHGIEHGRQQLEDEWRGAMEVSASVARFVAQNGSYADLCERRGETERAERQRRIVRERGISA
jgi:hypothetical protein